jgi:hypothetical protein
VTSVGIWRPSSLSNQRAVSGASRGKPAVAEEIDQEGGLGLCLRWPGRPGDANGPLQRGVPKGAVLPGHTRGRVSGKRHRRVVPPP